MRRMILLATILAATAGLVSAQAADAIAFAPVQSGPTADAERVVPYAPDRLLVQFAPGAVPAELAALPFARGARLARDAKAALPGLDAALRGVDVTAVERPYAAPRRAARATELGVDRWFLLRLQGADDLARVAERLRKAAGVAAVSLDWRAFPAIPDDPLYPDQWGHDNQGQMLSYDWATHSHENGEPVGTVDFDADADEAWTALGGYGDAGVVIAILDSGVDVDHPDLRLVAGYDFGDNDSNPDDNAAGAGHGTACAGVAAAIAGNGRGVAGVAGGSSVMPCKVADSGGSMYFSYIQDALYWAADNGADIISMSLGAGISSDPATDTALQYAYDAGVVIFAATGNENASTISYPAIHDVVIGVGAASPCGDRKRSSSSRLEVNSGVATDPNGYTCDGERWWGSNYGSTTPDDRGAVDVLAPTILPTTDIGGSGGYASGDYDLWFNGTSCATPYAAGVAALVLTANPGFTPAEVRDAITATATDVVNVESGAGWDRYSGYGLVDAAAAVGGGGTTPVAPTAAFSGTPTSGTAPLTVVFADLSSGSPTSWSWDFGDGGTATAQNPGHTYEAAGTYSVTLTVSNEAGSDTLTRAGYITVTEPGQTVIVTAGGETPVAGTVSGSYLATAADDGVLQTIAEVLDTSHPRKRTSYLEHRWRFELPAGGDATFLLAAARPSNPDGDDFVFEYSTDGATWIGLATVASATEQSFSVPVGSLSGAVIVRAYDTDRSWDRVSLDALAVDYLAFQVGDAQPAAPTADFTATPTSGAYPLAVQFTDQSGGQPTSWSWDFGDGMTSTAQNPAHTYAAAGTYTVSLTAANGVGSDTLTRTDFITVTEPGTGGDTMHVAAMAVSRKNAGPNVSGLCSVTIVDAGGQAVSDATVTVAFDGPSTGTLSGLTGANGVASFETGKVRNPSGEWCFEVTDVTHATLTYDSAANAVTRACESGTVYDADGARAARRRGPRRREPQSVQPGHHHRVRVAAGDDGAPDRVRRARPRRGRPGRRCVAGRLARGPLGCPRPGERPVLLSPRGARLPADAQDDHPEVGPGGLAAAGLVSSRGIIAAPPGAIRTGPRSARPVARPARCPARRPPPSALTPRSGVDRDVHPVAGDHGQPAAGPVLLEAALEVQPARLEREVAAVIGRLGEGQVQRHVHLVARGGHPVGRRQAQVGRVQVEDRVVGLAAADDLDLQRAAGAAEQRAVHAREAELGHGRELALLVEELDERGRAAERGLAHAVTVEVHGHGPAVGLAVVRGEGHPVGLAAGQGGDHPEGRVADAPDEAGVGAGEDGEFRGGDRRGVAGARRAVVIVVAATTGAEASQRHDGQQGEHEPLPQRLSGLHGVLLGCGWLRGMSILHGDGRAGNGSCRSRRCWSGRHRRHHTTAAAPAVDSGVARRHADRYDVR